MAISCVYCGGKHASAAQVRQCWSQRAPSSATPAGPVHQRLPGIGRALALATPGPDRLGRHVIVGPGDTAPPPWDDAQRVVIDAAALDAPTGVLERLRAAHHARRRLVIELGVLFDTLPASRTDAAPYEVGPRFGFELDELFHWVWGNSVDRRDPERPSWAGLDRALLAGARPAGDGRGDVVTPDGQALWLDGGPIRHTDPIDGVPVLHTVALEHRSLRPPGPNRTEAELAADQRAAVTHPGGPARIIAPAGSGKTRVLTERARHLLAVWNLPADAVSLVAFNKQAQEEMTARTADLAGLHVRTLNAIALAIINGAPPFASQPQRWRTIDEGEVRQIIGELVTFPRRRNSDPVAPWIEALSLIRLGLVSPEEAEEGYGGDVEGLAATWPKYRRALEARGAVDFDDQIHRALLVLLRDPVARRVAQQACRVMLVDEFQDLTPAHLLLIRLLAAPGGAVFGVGDDDQTIYGYNGADPAWLIDFAEIFPGAGSHPLEVNYRCPADIVGAVDRLLRHNRRRVDKTIRAAATVPAPIDGGGWVVDSSPDPVAATLAAVVEAQAQGAAPNEIAVLTRVNALLAPVQAALAGRGLPIGGGVGLEFADRTAVRTALAWIRLATGPARHRSTFDPADVREALRRPSRSFHPRITEWVAEQAGVGDLHRLATRLNNERDRDRVLEFAADIATLQAMVADGCPTAALVSALIDDIGLSGAVATLDTHRRGMNRSAQGDDLVALAHLAALHDNPATFEAWLQAQLAVTRRDGGVTLATVHRVKGQEWPHVVMHLADATQYPHRLAEDVEEERRLFHVALTRASTRATIVTGSEPSPFVAELTTEPPSGDAPAPVRAHRPETPPKPVGRATAKSAAIGDLDSVDRVLYDALCALRQELRDGKPAYVVFDNKTAAALAAAAPTTEAELLGVPGIGPAKVAKYGTAILATVGRIRR